MSNDDSGLDYRQKQLKRRTDISKMMFKLPIIEILKSVEKSNKFYGHIFNSNFNVSSLCNTQFLGSNFEKFINLPATISEDVYKKTDVKRNELKKKKQQELSRSSRILKRSMMSFEIKLPKLTMDGILDQYKVSKSTENFILSTLKKPTEEVTEKKIESLSPLNIIHDSMSYITIDESDVEMESISNSNDNSFDSAIDFNIENNCELYYQDSNNWHKNEKLSNQDIPIDLHDRSNRYNYKQHIPEILPEDIEPEKVPEVKKDIKLNAQLFEKTVNQHVQAQIAKQINNRPPTKLYIPIKRQKIHKHINAESSQYQLGFNIDITISNMRLNPNETKRKRLSDTGVNDEDRAYIDLTDH